MATSGRAGSRNAMPSASSSAAINGPAHAVGANLAMPWVVASARCAVPNASFTYTSHNAAIFFASASSFFFSPLLKRQFSSITTWPGLTSTPVTQSRINGTGVLSNSLSRCATGSRESAALNSPSVGRPRCDVTITAAPAVSAAWMAGTDARMRVSSVILPASSCGTLRSARMNTRLPARFTSAIFVTFMRKRRLSRYLAMTRVISSTLQE